MNVEELDLRAYLQRIRLSAPLPVSRESLAVITEAHVASIPFENLDILLGRPIALDVVSLMRKLVNDRRGGYCFEHNTLLWAVLMRMGYEVTPLAGRVVSDSGAPRPRTHMLLGVELPEGWFIVDVGFGGDGLLHPIPLQSDKPMQVGIARHRFRRDGGLWTLQADNGRAWSDLYSFELTPQLAVDYMVANHFTSTHPSSPFVANLTAQRVRRDRRLVLRNRTLTVREPGATHSGTVRDPEHLLALLQKEFGLSFPEGTRFRQPEF